MPGAYPRGLIKSQEDQDGFWNLRLGTMWSAIPAIVAGAPIPNKTLAVTVGVLVWSAGMWFTFRRNLAGRLMTRIMGPFKPEEW